jgi:hypothetical protein
MIEPIPSLPRFRDRLSLKKEGEHCRHCEKNGSLTISARSGYFSFRKVSKSLRQLKTAVTKISIYSNFAEIVKEPKNNETIKYINSSNLQ